MEKKSNESSLMQLKEQVGKTFWFIYFMRCSGKTLIFNKMVLVSYLVFYKLLNPSTIDEPGEWCLKGEPGDKPSQMHRVTK